MNDGMNPAPWQSANRPETGADEERRFHEEGTDPGREEPQTTEYGQTPYMQDEEKPSSKGKKRRKKRKKSKNYILRILIALAIVTAVICVLHVDYFKVSEVTVSGNEYMTEEQVLSGTKIRTGRNIFDTHILIEKHRIKKKKYVDDVKISREYPDKIKVQITEKKGLAQFAHGKKYVVTDNNGKTIEITKDMRNITLVNGINLKSVTEGMKVESADANGLKKIYKLLAAMDKGDLYFKSVSMSRSRVTAYIYDNLKVTGSYDNVMAAIENNTLKTVVYDLYQKGKNKGTIKVSGGDYCSFTE